MDNTRTLFLYYDPHYVHAAMAKAIGATFWPSPRLNSKPRGPLGTTFETLASTMSTVKAALTVPRDYDVYLCEGTYIFPALARKLGRLDKDKKIIDILASPILYYLSEGTMGGARRKFALSMLDEVDAFVCIGKMERDLLLEFLPDARYAIAYPFIQKDVLRGLVLSKGVLPELDRHEILFIGRGDPYYKGLDVLIDAFRIVKETWKDARLNIVGDISIPGNAKGVGGINRLGYVKDIVSVIKRSSVYVHPGRGDSFPVSSLEAMAGGLPTIVSEDTGTKEVTSRMGDLFVSKIDSNDLAGRINRIFDLEQKEKERLSAKFTREGLKFSQDKSIKTFIRGYATLMEG